MANLTFRGLRAETQSGSITGKAWRARRRARFPTACDDCARSDQARPPARRRGSSRPRLVSVLVSFTPVRHRSPVVALTVFAQATDADGRR
jgi:hypothetical protein